MRKLVPILLLLSACRGTPEQAASPSPTSPSPSPSPSPSGACTDQTAKPQGKLVEMDNFFDPTCLVLLGGQGITIRNKGVAKHNFSIEGTDVSLDTGAGQQTATEAIGGAVEAGTYTFFCKYHRPLGMVGELQVLAAG